MLFGREGVKRQGNVHIYAMEMDISCYSRRKMKIMHKKKRETSS